LSVAPNLRLRQGLGKNHHGDLPMPRLFGPAILVLFAASAPATAEVRGLSDAWVDLSLSRLTWEDLSVSKQVASAHLAWQWTDNFDTELTIGLDVRGTTNFGIDFGTERVGFAQVVINYDLSPTLTGGVGWTFSQGASGPTRTDLSLEWTLSDLVEAEVDYSPDGSLGDSEGAVELRLTPAGQPDYAIGYHWQDCPDPQYLCGGGNSGVTLSLAQDLRPNLRLNAELGYNEIVDIDFDGANRLWLTVGAEWDLSERVIIRADWTETDHILRSDTTRQRDLVLAVRWNLD
jgi:hypothetical protein